MKKLLFLLLFPLMGFSQDKEFPLLQDTLTDQKAVIVEAANLKHIVRVSDLEVADIVVEFYKTVVSWTEPIDFEHRLLQLQAVRKIYSERSEIGYIKRNVIYINAELLKSYPNTGRAALLHLLGQWQGMTPYDIKFKYNDWSENNYTKQREHRHTLKLIMNRLAEQHPVKYKI